MNNTTPVPRKLWFKRKLYGWGWYPASWQGWAVTFIYIALVLLSAMTLDDNSSMREVMFTFVLPFIFFTLAFIRISYRTGEKPRWQWSKRIED